MSGPGEEKEAEGLPGEEMYGTVADCLRLILRKPEETQAFGAFMAACLEEGDFLALDGDLAAGKTCLTGGLASGLGFPGTVTSPTFSLLHIYTGGRLPLYHFDLFRLEAPVELEGLGYEEYFYGDGICEEWSTLASEYLPARRIEVRLESMAEPGGESESRCVTITPRGGSEAWRQRLLHELAAFEEDMY